MSIKIVLNLTTTRRRRTTTTRRTTTLRRRRRRRPEEPKGGPKGPKEARRATGDPKGLRLEVSSENIIARNHAKSFCRSY